MVRSLFLSAIAAATLFAVPAIAAGNHGFTIANTYPKASINRVWYVQAGSGQQYREIVLAYPIGPNRQSNFTVPPSDYCLYDVRIKFSDETEQDIANVNVCRNALVSAS